jgi:endo-1,4-beta-xylanase
MDRRQFCGTSAAALLGATTLGARALRADTVGAVRAAASLRARASAHGILFGTAAAQGILSKDAAYAAAIARECAIITPEAELKWGTLRPSPTAFNFGPADWLLQWAQSQNIQMRGHTLVFWQSLPGWFSKTVNPGNAQQILQNHISTTCGHYAGKLHSWDVVNEGIDLSSGRPDGLRNSAWLQLLGPDYIAQAFQMARAADPQAQLVYNDFGFEYASPDQEARRRAVLALLTKLKSANVPIQALGLQTHLYAGMAAQFKPAVYQAFLKEVSDLGLKIFITEMDVQDGGLPGDPAARDGQVANIYKQVLSTALANPAVTVVETWGLADKYSWLQQHAPRKDQLEVRTLPFDDGMQPKPVYDAIGAALDSASARSAS